MGMLNSKSFSEHKLGDRVKPVCVTGPGLTKQEFAKEADINHIMKRYMMTGSLTGRIDGLQPIFADVSGIGDYADVLRRIDAARSAFGQLSAQVRGRFRNDAGELVDFLQDEGNRDEAISLGLLPPRAVAVEPVAPVVPVPIAPAVK